jgi:hypothetical protein
MKTGDRNRLGSVLAACVMGVAGTAFGANLYWDADGAGSGATGGTGTWDTSSLTWRLGSSGGTLQAWDNGTTGNSAYLAGTVGTLTLGANVTAAYLSASGGYVINGDGGGLYKLTLDSTSKVGGDGGTYAVMYNGGALTINAPVVLTGSFNHDFRGSVTFNGVVSDTGTPRALLSNFATITLNNANTFTGGYAGGSSASLVIGHDQGVGTGPINSSGTASIAAANGPRAIRNPISPSGGNAFSMTTGGTNNLTLLGGPGTGFVGGNGATFTVGLPVLTVNRPLFSYPEASNGKAFPYFTKNGTGTLVLNESASPTIGLTSGVNVNAGTLIVNGGSYAATSVNASVTAGSAQFTLTSGTTANLHVGQNVQAAGTYPTGTVIVSIDSATQFTVADPWGSSRTGGWAISTAAGLGSQTGNVTVAAGATLGGRGTIVMGTGRKVTLNAGTGTAPANWGGILSPGASAGTLTITGDVDVNNYAAYIFEPADVAANSDKVAVSGALSFLSSPTVVVKLATMMGDPTGQAYTLFTFGSTSGTPTWLLDTSGTGWTGGSIGLSGNSFVLSGMVPEPGALALLALAGVAALSRRRG